MRMITLWFPESILKALDCLVPKSFPNRAEAIRLAIRDLLMKEGRVPRAEISVDAMENLNVAMRLEGLKSYGTT